jgi:hypothetical protein
MSAPPLIVGFVQFLRKVCLRPLRIRSKHVSGVCLKAGQVGVAHRGDPTAQFSNIESLIRFRISEL